MLTRRLLSERPYRLATLGTSPVSDGGSSYAVVQSLPRATRGRGTMRSMVEGAL